MNELKHEIHETNSNLNADSANLHDELHDLRQRLAALEACVPQSQQIVRKPRRITPKMLTLLVAGVMLAGASIVFGQAAVDSLFISKDGKVGIGTSAPTNKLSVAGNTDVSGNLSVTGNVGIGATPTNKLSVAGNANISGILSLGTLNATNSLRADGASFLFANGSTDSTNNVVLRKDGSNAYIFPWGTGTSSNTVIIGGGARTNFSVSGDMTVTGNLTSTGRYQRDDNPEATYLLSPRYHVSLTAAKYDGSTRQIPQQVINDLCGDQDGCQFRLGMTRWTSNTETETASMTGIMYYSTADGHWRTSLVGLQGLGLVTKEAGGIDGNKKTEHVGDAWSTCFFTDSPYSRYQDQSDPDKGMYLLVWKNDRDNYTNPGRTCELTLID